MKNRKKILFIPENNQEISALYQDKEFHKKVFNMEADIVLMDVCYLSDELERDEVSFKKHVKYLADGNLVTLKSKYLIRRKSKLYIIINIINQLIILRPSLVINGSDRMHIRIPLAIFFKIKIISYFTGVLTAEGIKKIHSSKLREFCNYINKAEYLYRYQYNCIGEAREMQKIKISDLFDYLIALNKKFLFDEIYYIASDNGTSHKHHTSQHKEKQISFEREVVRSLKEMIGVEITVRPHPRDKKNSRWDRHDYLKINKLSSFLETMQKLYEQQPSKKKLYISQGSTMSLEILNFQNFETDYNLVFIDKNAQNIDYKNMLRSKQGIELVEVE